MSSAQVTPAFVEPRGTMAAQVRPGRLAVVAAATLAVLMAGRPCHAQLSDIQKKCFDGVAKAGAKFVKARLKAVKKCKDADLKAVDACDTSKRDGALGEAADKLAQGLDRSCAFSAANFANMGFPGQCDDANPADGFTTSDLKACIELSHGTIADELIGIEYDATLVGTLGPADLKCQKELSKNGQKVVDCVLKHVRKCRQGLIKGTIVGVAAERCQTDNDKTKAAIDKCKTKARDAILKKCSDAQVQTLKACTPDQTAAGDAADCLVDTHRRRADSTDATDPTDLVDYQYADPGLCGDDKVNSLDEECDGADDSACPGQCGTAEVPDGYFACLCKTKPRARIVEHFNADLDLGWTGLSHDSGLVEGGGEIHDLSECDAAGNCIVGPNCSLPPHAPCGTTGGPSSPTNENADAICAALGQGTCRKERTAIGPHCYRNIKQECDPKLARDPVCSAPGDFCAKTIHRPPLPIASGGVSVCVVNYFSEDVVGTTNILTGASTVRYRENSVTHSSVGGADKPCPVCGGFCAGNRERCALDGDCAAGKGPCVTAPICSDGPNQGKPCRVRPPFGGRTDFFGTTSVDCPPFPAADISTGGLDLEINPITTGSVTLLPSFACNAPAFTGNACIGGPHEGRPCTAASDCPSGTCSGQCFCPNVGGTQQPNACEPACVGGPMDANPCERDVECYLCSGGDHDQKPCTGSIAQCVGGPNAGATCTVDTDCGRCSAGPIPNAPCAGDGDCGGAFCVGGSNGAGACATASECPGGSCVLARCDGYCGNCPDGTCDTSGFCHLADCRWNPADTATIQEGECTVGPADGFCSITRVKSCNADADCQGFNCTLCQPGETCVFTKRNCFVNSGIHRAGVVGMPERTQATIFCIQGTGSTSINNVSGAPGPTTDTVSTTVILTGVP